MQTISFWGAAALTLALSGCAMLPGTSDGGWVTVIDGERGMENFDQVGTPTGAGPKAPCKRALVVRPRPTWSRATRIATS
jgi:hypothetical protein